MKEEYICDINWTYNWNGIRSYEVLNKNEKEIAAKCDMKNL